MTEQPAYRAGRPAVTRRQAPSAGAAPSPAPSASTIPRAGTSVPCEPSVAPVSAAASLSLSATLESGGLPLSAAPRVGPCIRSRPSRPPRRGAGAGRAGLHVGQAGARQARPCGTGHERPDRIAGPSRTAWSGCTCSRRGSVQETNATWRRRRHTPSPPRRTVAVAHTRSGSVRRRRPSRPFPELLVAWRAALQSDETVQASPGPTWPMQLATVAAAASASAVPMMAAFTPRPMVSNDTLPRGESPQNPSHPLVTSSRRARPARTSRSPRPAARRPNGSPGPARSLRARSSPATGRGLPRGKRTRESTGRGHRWRA